MKTPLLSKSILALACLSAMAATPVAQAAEPESTLAYNVGVVSEYRYRGLSQTRFKPAVQGGVDYADKSGLYVGAWASTISWIKDNGAGASGPVELDLYGGYKFNLSDVALDVGYLRYQYVNNTLDKTGTYKNANTDEAYVAGTYGPFTLKYSYAFSDIFGNINSKGSTYTDLSANFDLGDGYTLTPHVGYQYIKNNASLSYKDYALTLAKDLGDGLSVTAAAISVDGDKTALSIPLTASSDGGKFAGKNTVVLGLKYTF